ncbi:MAG: preprotein translocase subunit SecE [Clostridia bacterium]|nr:preprotein translocase subunit SecE [Clostridia bacterium]MBQ4638864.1 preprotein translocase subunit SecE [Clostridia bacterium]
MANEDIKKSTAVAKKADEKKPVKAKKARKSPVAYVKEVIAELKKVSWPNKKDILSYTATVVVFIVVMSLLLFGMDVVFGKLLDLILLI